MAQGSARKGISPEAKSGLWMVAPPALYAILLLAAPMATIILFSFLTDAQTGIEWKGTLANYKEVFTQPVYRALMVRSLIVSTSVTIVTVLLAYPVAYFVSFHVKPERKSLWLFLITIPFWTSYIIRVFLWKVILGYNGVINSGLMSLGIIDEPLQAINYNVPALVMTLAHAYAPFAILPIFVVLEKIDRSLLEAGQDLGEGRFRTFLRVTLPLSMPGVIAAVLIVFIPTIGDYVTPNLIGGGKLPMIANMMEAKMLGQDNKPVGSAIVVTAMLVVALVSLVFLGLNRRFLKGQQR
jgi:spermidine/putrescine transport system permease protein